MHATEASGWSERPGAGHGVRLSRAPDDGRTIGRGAEAHPVIACPYCRADRHDVTMTSLPAGYRNVDVPESRHLEMISVDSWAFPSTASDEQLAALPVSVTWDRARGVETSDCELVAFHGSYPYGRFPVPGSRTPVSGLTWVGVHPAHRRRGLLRSMITDHFTRSLERGESISALFAAEPAIYGRFGYGLAAVDLRMKIPRGAKLRDVPGADALRVRLERLGDRHGALMQAVHSRVDRPGWVSRHTPQQLAAYVTDPEYWRDGAESMRIAVVCEDGTDATARGYALFRRKSSWQDAGPRGSVWVKEAVAQDAATSRALWGVLLDLDLMASVEVWLLATDDPLWHLLVDTRDALPRISDNLWLRLLDVPTALAARRYSTAVDVVIEVRDERLPANAGRWRLVGGPDGADVSRAGTEADLALDVRDLGAAYLGGVSLAGLASAGLVTERTPGALRAAGTAFGWPVAPVCSWIW
jgi:predicted acetyltransferase